MRKRKPQATVAYQNKDIAAKVFSERMAGRCLSEMGWDTQLTVTKAEPTNLPAIEADELRLDNLFRLSDGSLAIIDYESRIKPGNPVKYLQYMARIIKRNGLRPGSVLRLFLLYTADVERSRTHYDYGCLHFQAEAAYLSRVDAAGWFREAEEDLSDGTASQETMMHLSMYPLCFKGKAAKNEAVQRCLPLIEKITEEDQRVTVLSGIATFADKVLTEEVKEELIGRIVMTEVGRMFYERAWNDGVQQGIQQGVQQGLQQGLEQGLEQGAKQGHARGITEGKIMTLQDLVEDGTLTLTAAARRAQLSEKQFLAKVKKIRKASITTV